MASVEPGLGPGSRLGGYRIESLVARGGMGVVYKATQLALERTVAIKVVAPELADDESFRERFKREARLAAALDHPNILPVYEAGEVDGHLFLAMRYVVGTDLDSLIRREAILAPERALGIVAQIADALDAAHSRGLIHRDVKPGNILIADEYGRERAYLTDFGLTKNVATDAHLTRTGQMVGTLDYVAPEQVQGQAVDGRADIYALACVLFQAVTGRIPFDRPGDVSKMWAHLNDPRPSAAAVNPALPKELDAVIRQGMAKRPEDRPPSAGAFAHAAREALRPPVLAAQHGSAGGATQLDPTLVEPLPGAAGAAGGRTPDGAPGQASRRGGASRRRRGAYAAAAVLGLLILGAIAAIAVGGGGTTSTGPPTSSAASSGPATTTATQPTASTSAADAQAAAYRAQVELMTPRLNAIFNHLPNGHDFLKPVFARTALADAAGVRGISDSLNALTPPPRLLTDHEALVAHLGELEQSLRALAVDSDNRDFTSAERDIQKLKVADNRVTSAIHAVKATGAGG